MHDGGTLDIDALIAVARGERSGEIAPATAARLAAFQAAFDSAPLPPAAPAAICFAFHAPVPPAEAAVKYRDIAIDHSKFDYDRIVRQCIAAALTAQPGARFILATDGAFLGSLSHPALTIVRLPLDAASPMYERVVAMCAFVRSRQFNAPTAFLDSDAFLNAPVAGLFQGHFDIGATYRPDPGLMPINEGVIFANSRNKDLVRGFFAGYLGTYDRLCGNATVTSYYGNVKRWRGGQLSLNALACPLGVPSELDSAKAFGARIRYYPCSTFNFSIELERSYSARQLDAKAVLHLKGPRKAVLDQIVAYQTQRRPEIAEVFAAPKAAAETAHETAQASAPADRAYSLDTTTPVDYEPPAELDWSRASLTEIADHFKTDKGSIKHNYTAVYERYLGGLRARPGLQLMEIGVACGSSLKMWSKYFADARILGVDIRPDCAKLCGRYPNISITIQDAAKAPVQGSFDIIIDDGSHVSADIVDAFRHNWPNLKPGGLFVIEDLKCTHNPQYRSLLPFDIPAERFERRHFMELVDRCLMDMDWRRGGIAFIHFYREMAVIGKAA
jgi:SAM-dependent methyltransferase